MNRPHIIRKGRPNGEQGWELGDQFGSKLEKLPESSLQAVESWAADRELPRVRAGQWETGAACDGMRSAPEGGARGGLAGRRIAAVGDNTVPRGGPRRQPPNPNEDKPKRCAAPREHIGTTMMLLPTPDSDNPQV